MSTNRKSFKNLKHGSVNKFKLAEGNKKQRKELLKQKPLEKETSGVVYLGHIPHGFYEMEMKGFFKQFGRVKQLRLSRSKKTAKSKGYAFIEFESETVAKLVAKTMNNYLMFEKLLKCVFVPKEKVHENMFLGSDSVFKPSRARRNSINRHNKMKSEVKTVKLKKRMLVKQNKCFSKLANLGIDFTTEDVAGRDTLLQNEGMPLSVTTKKGGKAAILWEDSAEEEISFKTPPNSVRSSKLKRSLSGTFSLNMSTDEGEDSPSSRPKRKITSTPVTTLSKSSRKLGQKAKLKKMKLKRTKVGQTV